jgi:glycosyltransferase involved in cell wall biosynthesis
MLGERLVQFGHLDDRTAYGRLLREADIVVSTSRHEFFGVGMVEALFAGCVPIAPDRYNYPALVPPQLHDHCLWHDEDDLLGKLRALLTGSLPDAGPLRASAERFAWPVVVREWDEAVAKLAGIRNSPPGRAVDPRLGPPGLPVVDDVGLAPTDTTGADR